MKTKKLFPLVLLVSLSFVTLHAQIYVDGTTGKVGVGEDFSETVVPDKELEVKGSVVADTFFLSDGTVLSSNGLITSPTGDIETNKKMIINNDMHVINRLKIGENSLWLGQPSGVTDNHIYVDEGENLLLQSEDKSFSSIDNTIKGKVGIGYDNNNDVKYKLDVNGDINYKGQLYSNDKPILFQTYNNKDYNITSASTIDASYGQDFAYTTTDGNTNGAWSTPSTPGGNYHLIYNLGNIFKVSKIQISQIIDGNTIGAGSLKVSYSLDKTLWTTIYPQTISTDAVIDINFSEVNARFIKLEMYKEDMKILAISEVEITGLEVLPPQSALWMKQTQVLGLDIPNLTDNIIYDKGNVTIGGNLSLKGWSDYNNKWEPKTFKVDWRGTIKFSRFYVQEPMVDGSLWARGLMAQNLFWDETVNKYVVPGGGTVANHPDFAAIVFENEGDIGFFTHDQIELTNTQLSRTDLDAFRRMTITREGNVKVKGNLYVGNALLNENTINLLTSGSNQWVKSTTNNDIYKLVGNIGIGTSNTQDFKLSVMGGTSYFQNAIGIGTTTICPNYLLQVNGFIGATEINVKTTWCDYVFKPEYKLRTLQEVEQFINENSHLPDVPSEAEVNSNGINVGEINSILLKKIEELTLYIIEQNKRIEQLEKINSK